MLLKAMRSAQVTERRTWRKRVWRRSAHRRDTRESRPAPRFPDRPRPQRAISPVPTHTHLNYQIPWQRYTTPATHVAKRRRERHTLKKPTFLEAMRSRQAASLPNHTRNLLLHFSAGHEDTTNSASRDGAARAVGEMHGPRESAAGGGGVRGVAHLRRPRSSGSAHAPRRQKPKSSP